MPLFVSLITPRHRKVFATARTVIASATFGVVLTMIGAATWAQSSPTAHTPAAQPAPQTFLAANSGPQWQELPPAQQKILLPLTSTWNSLPAERKSKWIALAQKYPSMGTVEQEKLQSRMAEWAALNPKERERARLNFAETKKVSPSERSAEWETYQALSPEEKQKLAARAKATPPGAAVAVKPVDPNKLTAVPLTRRTLEQNSKPNVAKPQLDRHTLLPRPPAPAIPAVTPTPAATPEPAH